MSEHFRVFLSHSYAAGVVNLYFHGLLSEVFDLQFEVDEGAKQTSVTRLERMIRECDGFVGIYPLSDPSEQLLTPSDLRHKSRYFRLELDLANRSQRPALVYADQRFSGVLRLPPWARVQWYDSREIMAGELNPARQELQAAARAFLAEVEAFKRLRLARPSRQPSRKFAIVLPGNAPDSVYTPAITELIECMIEERRADGADVIYLPDPRGRRTVSDLETYDVVIADVGMHAMRNGFVGFMHARFLPMVRMLHHGEKEVDALGVHRCLHADIEAGYDKDLIVWNSADDLRSELKVRLNLLAPSATLITGPAKAQAYFEHALKLKDAVFLSYSGGDASIARQISRELKARFQSVFDYQDGVSLEGGAPWMEQINLNIGRSAIGVQIISQNYLDSPNCRDEAKLMHVQYSAAKMDILRIKISKDPINPPGWMIIDQYFHVYEDDEVKPTVAQITDFARRRVQQVRR